MVIGLSYPWLLRINVVCATLIAGLLLFRERDQLAGQWLLPFSAVLMAWPATVFNDPLSGYLSAWIWLIVTAGMVFSALWERIIPHIPASMDIKLTGTRVLLGLTLTFSLILISISTGTLAVGNRQRYDAAELRPEVRDIWRAVRMKTPKDALVFTDQVSEKMALLGGWNTFSFSGQRQIYISTIYWASHFRIDETARKDVLEKNTAVLDGRLRPSDIVECRQFVNHFAVISISRQTPATWRRVYANQAYALFQIE